MSLYDKHSSEPAWTKEERDEAQRQERENRIKAIEKNGAFKCPSCGFEIAVMPNPAPFLTPKALAVIIIDLEDAYFEEYNPEAYDAAWYFRALLENAAGGVSAAADYLNRER